MLTLYVDRYKEWRTFAAPYYYYTMVGAKKSIIALFRGGRCPPGDVPFHQALWMEVRKAATYLCSHRIYAHLGHHYAHRARPLFGHLPSIISFEVDAAIIQIMNIANPPPICMVLTDRFTRPCI